jgi:hypothetical protein
MQVEPVDKGLFPPEDEEIVLVGGVTADTAILVGCLMAYFDGRGEVEVWVGCRFDDEDIKATATNGERTKVNIV